MVGGFDSNYGTTATGILNSQVDISANPIDVYVKIYQTAKCRYKNTTGFDITITATALSATIDEVAYSTAIPTIVASAAGNAVVNAINNQKNDFTTTKKSAANGEVVFTVAYPTGAPVPANTIVGTITFTVTWAKDVTAPDGIYQASVILRVSPQ